MTTTETATPTQPRFTSYRKDAKEALGMKKVRGANALLSGIALLVAAFVFWASQATIDEVTKGIGKVIPSRSIQTIQNLEGGILAEVLVQEGGKVKAGQILARIDDTMSSASFRENLTQLDALEASAARLRAEASSENVIDFSPRIQQKRPDLVVSETTLFNKRRADLKRQTDVIETSLRLASEELEMTVPLVERRVVSKVEQLRLKREVNELQGKLADLRNDLQRTSMEQLNEAMAKMEGLGETSNAREDRVNRTVVRSPVDGTVNKVHITTVGGVIQPGEPIMDLVPADDTLLVSANIRPSDIGFLHPGQEATVKLTAYDFALYGGLKGEVEHISADTIQDEVDKEHYYQIKVRNGSGTLKSKSGEMLEILPGMVAQVDVLTGRRTVLQYLLKPFHRARYNALSER